MPNVETRPPRQPAFPLLPLALHAWPHFCIDPAAPGLPSRAQAFCVCLLPPTRTTLHASSGLSLLSNLHAQRTCIAFSQLVTNSFLSSKRIQPTVSIPAHSHAASMSLLAAVPRRSTFLPCLVPAARNQLQQPPSPSKLQTSGSARLHPVPAAKDQQTNLAHVSSTPVSLLPHAKARLFPSPSTNMAFLSHARAPL